MTAALTAGQSAAAQGLRPFDPGRDLTALADLIETGFHDSLDSSGRRMVHGLRSLGRLGRLGGWLSRWLLPPAANPQGFVWEQGGEVLGNASLLPVTGYPHRWVMANVAVQPRHRRKGIARALVTASLDYVQQRGGKEVILQVDQGNQAALQLYETLGFDAWPARTSWAGRPAEARVPLASNAQVRRRKPGEWHRQLELARRLHPEGLVWPYPTSAGFFRPSPWPQRLRLTPERHWVWFERDRLLGSSSLRWGLEPGRMRLILLVEPERQGQIEADLLQAVLQQLPPLIESLAVDYPSGVAEGAFRHLGFSEQRRLVWMEKRL